MGHIGVVERVETIIRLIGKNQEHGGILGGEIV